MTNEQYFKVPHPIDNIFYQKINIPLNTGKVVTFN